jgi:methionyl-tRNA formyltransferase
MRIVFFGTPDFAVPSLQALIDEGADLVGVVTQPDRARGRSRSTFVPPPVKVLAEQRGLPVLQPETPTGDVFLQQLRHLHAELGVVVAYGHILRPPVLDLPPRGMINVHASLLPRFRGAAPIQHAILHGDAVTGITIMQMDRGMDSGDILHQVETWISPEDTAGTLTERLARLGAEALVEALALMQMGRLERRPQDHAAATFAPKIDRALGRVSWAEPAHAIALKMRALDPAPGAWTTFSTSEVKLFGPRVVEGTGEPGLVLAGEPELRVAAGAGAVEIAEVQPAGATRMTAAAWARGRGPRPGQRMA